MNQLKYKKVEMEIRQLARTLPNGAKLPPERELAITYGCNFLTIRKALKELVDDGTVVRRIGSGTFISPRKQPPAVVASEDRVGLLVYQHGDAYAQQLLRGIAHASLEERIDVRSGWMRDFAEDGLRLAESLKQAGCAALTLPWFPLDMVPTVAGFVRNCPLPVSLPMVIPGFEANYFGIPELFGVSLVEKTTALCRYFQYLGRPQVALLGPASPSDVVLQRLLGAYTCHTSLNGMPNLIRLVPRTATAMDQLASDWQSLRGELAVICYDDEHALRLMTAMHKIGLSAPADFAVVGHNNSEASHFSDPPLSTMHQNFTHIGRALIRHALALAKGGADRTGEAPTIFVVRGTCGGAGRIDASFKTRFPELEIREEAVEAVPHLDPVPLCA